MLAEIGSDIEVTRPIAELSTGQEQMVQIAAALGTQAQVIIMDEPTSSLSVGESGQLFALLAQLKKSGQSIGTDLEFHFVPFPEWFAAIEDPKANEKYDYLLGIYAASERYPAVQLRFLTGPLLTPPYDLKKAETPDLKPDQIELLRNYQKWLLRSRQTIPFYFTVSEILYQNSIDIGAQPASDAEIELWRVQGK